MVARGLGCDGFHPEVPLQLWTETMETCELLREGSSSEGDGRNKRARLFFLIPHNFTSELHRVGADSDLMVWVVAGRLRYRDSKNGIELGGMLTMCAMDELLYGTRCRTWEDLNMDLAELTRERWCSCLIWPLRLSVSVWFGHYVWACQSSCCVSSGSAFQFLQTDPASLIWLLWSPAARSLRSVRGAVLHHHSRPPCVEVDLPASVL